MQNVITYLENHWSHITAAGAIIIAHGGIWPILKSLWNGNPKPKQTPPQAEASKPEIKTP